MAERSKVVTSDPEVTEQLIDEESGSTVDDGEEQAELEAVQFETSAGEPVTFERGVDLFDGAGNYVGEITEILYSLTATQTASHSTDWYHTITIAYDSDDVCEGGVPLGELAQQWDEGVLTTIPEALAEHGRRKLLLWELNSDGQGCCGVQFLASERGLENAPVEEKVEAFVDDMLTEDGTVRDEYDDLVDWDDLENRYGEIADLYLSD
ncbi:hypothetical protein [Halorhabdus rudnickae]|uniref:hypothetical protein n=1 Tax=Halorhabdus rudnickae TaxID=1775544 RepID=UPI00313ED9B7